MQIKGNKIWPCIVIHEDFIWNTMFGAENAVLTHSTHTFKLYYLMQYVVFHGICSALFPGLIR